MTEGAVQRVRHQVIPDVEGLTVDNARIMLSNLGFPAPRIHFVEAYSDEDAVVRIEPAAGQLVPNNTQVMLAISKPSYVRHLPSIYQLTGQGADVDFLRRYLRIFQHVFESVRGQVDRLHTLFDPLQTDARMLPWLASWLALVLDPDWPDDRKRRLIRSATELYSSRGTPRALRQFLEIFTGVTPEIRENEFPYEGFRVGRARIGVDSVVLPRIHLAHAFVVELPLTRDEVGESTLTKIHGIIGGEKPGHTTYLLRLETRGRDGVETAILRIGATRLGTRVLGDEVRRAS